MSERPENLSAAEAVARLNEGNARYVADAPKRPNANKSRRDELVTGQRPFATIVTCADSRVGPELVFDQGLGDLFVIRVAGNITDDAIMGSIEYASAHLGVNLVVIMGHQSCGAVGATVDNVDVDGPATHSHIDSLIDAIRPAVKAARANGEDDLLERSIKQNAVMVAAQVRVAEPIMDDLCSKHSVEIRPAYYELTTGKVHFVG